MDWLNYHHLLYFWLVVREGGVSQAAAVLRLAHPTVSGQVHALEDALGERLLEKRGRRLVLTEMGAVVYRYADEIFSLGRELMDTVKGRPTGRAPRLAVGIAEVVPKLVARRLLEPARALTPAVRLVCREDTAEHLLAALAAHELDVVLSDGPLPVGSPVRAFSHVLGESQVAFFGRRDLAAQYRRGFPGSLSKAPVLLPAAGTALRRALEQWFEARGVRPEVVGEFDDSALMKSFGQDGAGLFPAHLVLEREVRHQHDVEHVGRVDGVRETFYALSAERRIRHPAVSAICAAARSELFREAT